MKRISKLSVIALAAFLILGSLPVMAVARPFGGGTGRFVLANGKVDAVE